MNRLLIPSICCLLLLAPALRADEKDKPKVEQVKTTDTFDVIIKDMVASLKAATKAMTDVTDQKSADKAKPELEKIGQELVKIKERFDKLGQPSKEQEAELEKKFKSELGDAVTGVATQTKRILAEPYGKDLIAALKQTPRPPAPKPEVKPKDEPKKDK